MRSGGLKGERFPIWLKRPGDRVRAAKVPRDLAAEGEAGRAADTVKPTPPPGAFSPLFGEFLALCLEKDPSRRLSAKDLLKHPWLKQAAPTPRGGAGGRAWQARGPTRRL